MNYVTRWELYYHTLELKNKTSLDSENNLHQQYKEQVILEVAAVIYISLDHAGLGMGKPNLTYILNK